MPGNLVGGRMAEEYLHQPLNYKALRKVKSLAA